MRLPWSCGLAGLVLLLAPRAVPAQDTTRINIYRYILDMDVPEPAALVALDAAPLRVLRGSAPKPVAAALLHSYSAGEWRTGAAAEAAPFYVLGGGVRAVAAHRAMTVRGRLMRMLTKTIVSVAAIPLDAGSYDLGVAMRSTLHDPHDPTTATRLPEQVDSLLVASGAALPVADTDLRGVGGDLPRVVAAARRDMRARGGDVQVAAGLGFARSIAGAGGDGTERGTRHTLWLTGQHTRGARTDMLATVQLVDAPDANWKLRLGAGIQAKAAAADLRAEFMYDTTDRKVYPGVAVESNVVPGVGAVLSLASEAGTIAARSRQLRLTTLVRWHAVTRY